MEAIIREFYTSQAGFRIAAMNPELLISVVSLETECGLSSRGVESYLTMISDPQSILLVAIEDAGQIIGVFSGVVVIDELQIDNLAVSDRWRRQGIGKTLLRTALSNAKRMGACTATLEVRLSNSPARALYEKEGFTEDAVRTSYYTAPVDDALLLSREI